MATTRIMPLPAGKDRTVYKASTSVSPCDILYSVRSHERRVLLMGEQQEKKPIKRICTGLLAHVDAGKTTLSEAILYTSGAIRKLGRVDHKTAFLDSSRIEQDRGITVFSKEARLRWKDREFILLDTPGHADFSAEAERTLNVLDAAVLIVSGVEGVQSHTMTIWKLLAAYRIPVFVFVNKMDREGARKDKILSDLKGSFGSGFVEFADGEAVDPEELACCSEEMTGTYLEDGCVKAEQISRAVAGRQVFPVCFGSALKNEGTDNLLTVLALYGPEKRYGEDFSAKVYKISRDKRGVRQTHMKITGGVLRAKDTISGKTFGHWSEKADEIRLYSGSGYEAVKEASAGQICAVTGLSHTFAGEGLGADEGRTLPHIEPAMTYRMILPDGTDPARAMESLSRLSEEDPTLNIRWNDRAGEIQVRVMGTLELEILRRIIKERFDLDVDFDNGTVIYKETVKAPVTGIGHFEPLRHYAEVHLRLEPLPRGSGMVFDSEVSEDVLDGNWQRLILTHLAEREHPGVLTGSPVTDMKITLTAGRGHLKHTEGGDFRQATYRAVRQGLKKAECILLEPMYAFSAEVPIENLGRLLSDLNLFGAECSLPENSEDGRSAVVEGRASVSSIGGYPAQIAAYTGGKGRISLSYDGYGPCSCQEQIDAGTGYDSERDINEPTGSVFCEKGGAVYVPWDRVDEAAHIKPEKEKGNGANGKSSDTELSANAGGTAGSEKELEAIFLRTYGKSKRDEELRRRRQSRDSRPARPRPSPVPPLKEKKDAGEKLLIIDGYNVIFAWEELKALAEVNLDSAREAFLEILENYCSYKNIRTMAVFDSYRVSGGTCHTVEYANVTAVFTAEAETADKFIEKAVYRLGKQFEIKVVTSDRMVQMAALGDGAARMSSAEFVQEVTGASEEIRLRLKKLPSLRNRPFEVFNDSDTGK